MTNQQLLDFIKQQLLKGVDKETITKELLGGGWAEQDIQEGFNAVNAPVINPIISPIVNPVVPSGVNNPILTQTTNHSSKKVILIIVALFIIAGGVSGYYFRNYIPVIKDLIKTKTTLPVDEIKQEENIQAQTSTKANNVIVPSSKASKPTIVGYKLSLPTDKKQLEQLLNIRCSVDENDSMCITIKAAISQDVKLCSSIIDVEAKFDCILEIDPSKITSQLCDSIPLYAPGTKVYSSGVNVYNTCYSELANQSSNVKYCKNRINVMDEKDTIDNSCLIRLAIDNNSLELCKEITDNNDKFLCFEEFARKNNDKNICNMIDNTSDREYCKLQIK